MRLTAAPAPDVAPTSAPAAVDRREAFHTLASTELFKGLREVRIRHGEGEYRLRQTRAGKLILTK